VSDLPDNFANHPESVTERRGQRAENALLWTPRDALIDLLRRIDRGESEPTGVVVCYRENVDGGKRTRFSLAGVDAVEAQGIMSRVAWMMNDPGLQVE
jgi:hypothetical protein